MQLSVDFVVLYIVGTKSSTLPDDDRRFSQNIARCKQTLSGIKLFLLMKI